MRFKNVVILILFSMIGAFSFCENWYVCLASFKSEEKADELVKILENEKISTTKTKFFKDNENVFRVFYSEIFTTLPKAQVKRDNLLQNNILKNLKLNDLWCCKETEIGEVLKVQISEEDKQIIIVTVNGVPYKKIEIKKSENKQVKININIDKNTTNSVRIDNNEVTSVAEIAENPSELENLRALVESLRTENEMLRSLQSNTSVDKTSEEIKKDDVESTEIVETTDTTETNESNVENELNESINLEEKNDVEINQENDSENTADLIEENSTLNTDENISEKTEIVSEENADASNESEVEQKNIENVLDEK